MRIFSVAKRINKKITISKADDSDSNSESWLTESYSFDLPFFWKFTYIPRYIKYFNSFEAENLPIVESSKYFYCNSAELYKETRLSYFLRSKVYDYLREYDKRHIENKSMYLVKVSDLFQVHTAIHRLYYA